jgi:short-subunit dehydrogenase
VTDLAGKTCVVTGATSGIGRSLTIALTERGGHVYAIGRSSERLDSLLGECAGSSGEITGVLADLEQDEGIGRLVELVLAEHDGVDVLAHSAGAIVLGELGATTLDDLDRQYRVNLRAPVALTQALLPALKRARGQVVFVNSSAALRASATNVLYAATKAGLKWFADGLRDQLNADGVRVMSVYVGRTATPMQEYVHEQEGRTYDPDLLLQPGDVVQALLSALAMPVTAEITDIRVRPMRKPAVP